MKVHLAPAPWLSQSIFRVERALRSATPPGVRIVADRASADLEILHVVGRGCVPDDVGVRPYAVIQYCIRTTETKEPESWVPLWSAARAVWSYYDLSPWASAFRFYDAPLGVDGRAFRRQPERKLYLVGTSGYVAHSESIGEVATAVERRGGRLFHLGPNLALPGRVDYVNGITDEELARRWSRCRYVSALRREEGFELPALEALACGVRPILFGIDCYHRWFAGHAVFVPELPPDELTDVLVDILAHDPDPVTTAERRQILDRFSWPTIAAGFWREVLR